MALLKVYCLPVAIIVKKKSKIYNVLQSQTKHKETVWFLYFIRGNITMTKIRLEPAYLISQHI